MTSALKKTITPTDLLSLQTYTKEREQQRAHIISLKKERRLFIGPSIVFHFENYETILFQIQEMLFIEKGGDEQIIDELKAYTPLIPQGNNITATMMIEVPNIQERKRLLNQIGHIEQSVFLQINEEDIPATPIDTTERTTVEGKTSAVHFLNFALQSHHKKAFEEEKSSIILKINHPNYPYSVPLSWEFKKTLAKELE
jgi:hypothetical protein